MQFAAAINQQNQRIGSTSVPFAATIHSGAANGKCLSRTYARLFDLTNPPFLADMQALRCRFQTGEYRQGKCTEPFRPTGRSKRAL
jgi:hypothetical protein